MGFFGRCDFLGTPEPPRASSTICWPPGDSDRKIAGPRPKAQCPTFAFALHLNSLSIHRSPACKAHGSAQPRDRSRSPRGFSGTAGPVWGTPRLSREGTGPGDSVTNLGPTPGDPRTGPGEPKTCLQVPGSPVGPVPGMFRTCGTPRPL
jgi:hypothetical protein